MGRTRFPQVLGMLGDEVGAFLTSVGIFGDIHSNRLGSPSHPSFQGRRKLHRRTETNPGRNFTFGHARNIPQPRNPPRMIPHHGPSISSWHSANSVKCWILDHMDQCDVSWPFCMTGFQNHGIHSSYGDPKLGSTYHFHTILVRRLWRFTRFQTCRSWHSNLRRDSNGIAFDCEIFHVCVPGLTSQREHLVGITQVGSSTETAMIFGTWILQSFSW